MIKKNRIMAIDPGEKNIGVAVSDQTGTIANPLTVIKHSSRDQDAEEIIRLADRKQVQVIVIGQALDWDGQVSYQGRKAARLAAVLREKSKLSVKLWNEYGSTKTAQDARRAMGVSREKRQGHLDEIAATVILQSYLDSKS